MNCETKQNSFSNAQPHSKKTSQQVGSNNELRKLAEESEEGMGGVTSAAVKAEERGMEGDSCSQPEGSDWLGMF